MILFLFKTHNVPETGFCLSLQVEHTQLCEIDKVSPYLRKPGSTQDKVCGWYTLCLVYIAYIDLVLLP
jgi:hypothetical protein